MSEKLTPTTEVKALIQSQGADDADLMRIPPTRGCNCYMKVLSANDVDWEEELWSVINVPQVSSGGDPLEINGHSETEWKRYLSDPSWSPLPSKYYLMNYPASGTHMFYLLAQANADDIPLDFTVNLKVKCIGEQANGSLTYDVYYPSLVWKDGGILSGFDGFRYRPYFFDFDCTGEL